MTKRDNSFLLRVLYLALAGVMLMTMLGRNGLTSVLFYVSMILSMGLWLSSSLKAIRRTNSLAIAVAFLAVLNVLLNIFFNSRHFYLGDLTKLLSFVFALLFFACAIELETGPGDAAFLFRWNTGVSLLFIAMYVLQHSQMYLFNGIVTDYLTFRFTNPNLTALFLICNCMMELVAAIRCREKKGKLLHLAVAAVMGWFIWETKARNGQLALVMFLAVYGISVVFRRRVPRIARPVALGIALFPGIFAALYSLLIHTPVIRRMFSFLISAGKDLNSRERIWQYAWEKFRESPLIGSFTQILHGSTQSHMHNSHVDVLASYGGPVFVLFCVFLYTALTAAGEQAADRWNRMALWAFGAILFSGMGESTIFSGGLAIYVYAGAFLFLATQELEETS